MFCILTSNLDIFSIYFGYNILNGRSNTKSQKPTLVHLKVFKVNMFIHFYIVIDLSNKVFFFF